MLLLVLVIFIAATILFWQAHKQQKELGLPAGRVIYTDTRAWGPVQEPLYDPILGLAGRPDYLVQNGKQYIPVEVKSSRVAEAPYDAHIFQLAAYCRLVESIYGNRPTYGILHYPNRTFAIDYTPQLEAALLNLLDEIRTQERHKEIQRSHESPARCQGCGYRSICEQRLR